MRQNFRIQPTPDNGNVNIGDKVITIKGSDGITDKDIDLNVQAVLPEAVALAGSDIAPGPNGENVSKSGENYLTLRYDRVVPLLVNAIKELKTEFDAYKLTHP
jgi:hypothetical protein